MEDKHKKQNSEILIGWLAAAAFAGVLPLVFGTDFITILRGCTGWATCASLGIALFIYVTFVPERLLYRVLTIGAIEVLFIGYLMYNIFNLEAIKFASSALIFDLGTALVAINIIARSWNTVLEWLKKANYMKR